MKTSQKEMKSQMEANESRLLEQQEARLDRMATTE